jgi:hypothetical protein
MVCLTLTHLILPPAYVLAGWIGRFNLLGLPLDADPLNEDTGRVNIPRPTRGI